MNQEVNEEKKRAERFVLDLVLAKLDEAERYEIVPTESPDFILTDRLGKIGVEVARAYSENENFIRERGKKIENRVIRILRNNRLYYDEKNKYPNVSLEESAKSYQILIPPFYLNEVEEEDLNIIPNLFKEWIENGMPESRMFRFYENYSPITGVELIYTVGSVPVMVEGKLLDLCEEHPLHKIIKKKNDLLAETFQICHPDIKEWWLCLEVSEDSTLSTCQYTIPSTYPNRYNRMFMVDSNRFRVYEFEVNTEF